MRQGAEKRQEQQQRTRKAQRRQTWRERRRWKILLSRTWLWRPISQDAEPNGDFQVKRGTEDYNGGFKILVRTNTQDHSSGQGNSRREKGGRRMHKKAFLLYIQSWLARDDVDQMARTAKEKSEELKGRKSYIRKIKEMAFDIRKCELYPMISGYQETKS